MANIQKFQQAVRVGAASADPSGAQQGTLYWNTTDGQLKFHDSSNFLSVADLERLASTSNGDGASLIGIEDVAGNFTATDVEAALAEVYSLAAAGGTSEFADNLFRIQDDGDATKEIAFQASNITTGTVRTITMPDSNVDLGKIDSNESDIATNTSDIAANTSDIADLRTTQGTSDGDTDLGTFTGTTIPDSSSVKGALQSLETAHESSASDLTAHLDGGANKHDASEVDYERADGSKKNIQASSDDVENALTDLDDAIGALDATPTNYTPTDAGIVADHLAAIDSQLASAAGTEFSDNDFRVQDNADATKEIALEASNISTATTRTITMPDEDVDLGDMAKESVLSSNANGEGASTIGIEDASSQFTSTNVEGALDEALDAAQAAQSDIDDHIADSSGAHAASAISFSATGDIVATDVQAAIAEVDSEKASLTELASTANGEGASLIGVEDAGGKFTAANVEAVLSELQDNIDAAQAGLKVKDPVDLVATSNITLSGEQTIDGVLTSASRVLVAGQTNSDDNGIYVSAAGAWTRATDFDGTPNGEVAQGNVVYVLSGTDNADTQYVLNNTDAADPTSINVGSESNEWTIYSRAQALVGGNGILKSGLDLSVDHDGEGLTFSGTQLSLELDGSTLSKSASGLKVNEISNSEVAAAAAIEFSKMENLTADRALASDSNGDVSASSVTAAELAYLSGVTSGIQSQLDNKLENVSEDSSPSLGGDLDLNSQALLGDLRLADTASPTRYHQWDYIDSIALTASTTAVASDLTFDSRDIKGMEVEYTIVSGNERRMGALRVTCDNAASVASADVSITDNFNETADIDVSWDAAVNGNNIELSYTTGAGAKTMRAVVKQILA